MPEERPRRTHSTEPKHSASGWQLIAVQSISCIVVILIALAFRMVGGSAFAQLRGSFNDSLMSNSILATIAALMDASPADSEGSSDAEESKDSDDGEESSDADSTSSSVTEEESSAVSSDSDVTSESSTSASGTTTTAGTTTAPSAAVTKTASAGGKDIQASSKKVLYAPEGATFATLKINRLASAPLPVGILSSGFGYRTSPTTGKDGFHQGMDIAADMGTPVSAMFFGVVSEVGQSSSYGNYVKLYHGNGLCVLYAHCSEILVTQGAVIRAGEVVARVGSTGDSTGPHLHVEITLHDVAYDPSSVVTMYSHA